jgi:hypothetical protein
MKVIDFSLKKDEIIERKKANLRLVKSILYTTSINPHEEELIYIIGRGTEKNNTDALFYWVENITYDTPLPYSNTIFDLLRDMLQIVLETYD